MIASQPLISVVMPSYNQVGFIGAAIRSVLEQDYPNIELIVADGGSDDGTVDLLKARQAADGRLRWFSRRDSGPAQAINAVLDQVRGTFVGWLNSDDLYTPGAVRRAMEALQANPKWLMVYGHGQHVDGDGKPLNHYPTLAPSTPVTRFAEGCFICQPTVFSRRSMWVLLGKLDENLKTAFDFDYWLRAFLGFPDRIGFVDALQAYSRLHDACITLSMRRTVALEGMRVLARHVGRPKLHWLLTCVEEWYASYPFGCGFDDLSPQVAALVEEAKDFLHADDLASLRDKLAKDARLQMALPGVYADVYVDGWAPPMLELRLRGLPTYCSSLVLQCVHASPINSTLMLTIKADWGTEFQVFVGEPGPFEFEIPLTEALPGRDAFVYVVSDEMFIPNRLSQDATDDRELAYIVEKLQLVNEFGQDEQGRES